MLLAPDAWGFDAPTFLRQDNVKSCLLILNNIRRIGCACQRGFNARTMLQRERHRGFGALPVLPEKSPIAAAPSSLDIHAGLHQRTGGRIEILGNKNP